MISRIVALSEELARKKKQDPDSLERMEAAFKGQSPPFLLISPISRSSQDLQLLDMRIGDAFHATRIPRASLLPPDKSPVLWAGPASYNHSFRHRRGVILTFERDESSEVIKESLLNLSKHPDLEGLPVLALRVDYDRGRAQLEPHDYVNSPEAENWVLSRIKKPDRVDSDLLVLICSDSRVQPPPAPNGLPLAIRALGGYIPCYSGMDDESSHLNAFFRGWLGETEPDRRILIIEHGSFKGSGAPCGAALASMNPGEVRCRILRPLIEQIRNEASRFEEHPVDKPEDRVIALASAIRESLLSYPSVSAYSERNPDDFIEAAFMNTVTHLLSGLEG